MLSVKPLPPAPDAPRFDSVAWQLVRDPLRIVRFWNWKAALLSTFLRGPIFLVAGLRHGLGAAFSAVATEALFCAATAGVYGAIAQMFRAAQPQWLTLAFLSVGLPSVFQVTEYLVHRMHGTPHLRIAEMVSVGMSGISALFNWYAMRRETLLVGAEGASFYRDLARLPRLLIGFITALPRRWLRN